MCIYIYIYIHIDIAKSIAMSSDQTFLSAPLRGAPPFVGMAGSATGIFAGLIRSHSKLPALALNLSSCHLICRSFQGWQVLMPAANGLTKISSLPKSPASQRSGLLTTTSLSLYIYIYIHMYLSLSLYIYIYIHKYMYVYMYVCMYVCVYIYIYTYVYIYISIF